MPSAPKNLRRRCRHLQAILRLGQRCAWRYRRIAWLLEPGAWGERAAARHLEAQGLIILKRNWRSHRLEADIIALEGKWIVVAEVKTRHVTLRDDYPALLAVHREKLERLKRLARRFARNNGPLFRRLALRGARIDGVEVYYRKGLLGLPRVCEVRWHRALAIPELPPVR